MQHIQQMMLGELDIHDQKIETMPWHSEKQSSQTPL
jgi:hypothetical protein